jgi:MEMO1 family protein
MLHKRRPPAVAGMFYPDEPQVLQSLLTRFLDLPPSAEAPPKAIIVPHAGYIYSGPIAASAYALLRPAHARITRVVLLGPSHRVGFRGLAASAVEAFITPLGEIALDQDCVRALLDLPQVKLLEQAHSQEHSLEVHLPFLQSVLDDFRLIPLVVGEASPPEVAEVLEKLWGGSETLIVISSDLSHYLDYTSACALDQQTSAAIEALRYEDIDAMQACGAHPLKGLLYLARQRGLHIKTVDLRNSGDTAGNKDRVVGYGAYVLH